MTLGELRKLTAHLPDSIDVMIEQTNDESRYGMSQQAEVRKVLFGDEYIPKKEWPTIKCLIISDEF